MINLLFSLLLTAWIVAIAILAIQNATPVSLTFLTLQSIQLPVGVVLAFSVVLGLLGTAVLQLFWGLTASSADTVEDYLERDEGEDADDW